MEKIQHFFLWLYDEYGINFIIFYDPWEFDRYLKGLATTLELCVICVVLSVVVGVVGAWLQGSRFAPVRWAIYAYIQFFRNTPPLAQMYFFYFGLGSIMPKYTNDMGLMQPMMGNYQWAIIALTLFAGAFNVEIFRSGIEAVPKTTVEASKSLGYSRLKSYIYILFPLAMRICMPSLTNNLVNLLKSTSIAYAIGVTEVLYVANQIWAVESNVPEMMNVVLVTYLTIVSVFVWMMSRIVKRMRIPGYNW
ncbi:amino acid ABC transporter permease [Sneathiella sp.]|uniref:amino acid ABC transporter permease n=1 Tax=Sneathiella sp. TaxID=1964365 RepID=UPI0035662698